VRIQSFSIAVSAVALVAASAAGQQCDSVSSQTSLSAFAGARIGSLRIVTQSPPAFPGLAKALDNLHVKTREATVKRQLLFTAGDTVDTLAIGESIRRLRHLRYLRDVELHGVRCGTAPVNLVLNTRDDWSVKPKVQVGSRGKSEIGVTERNLLGSGRELSMHVRSQQGRVGVGFTFNDPWLLGSRFGAQISQDSYRDGQELSAMFRLREETVLAPWGAELGALVSSYQPAGKGLDNFERASSHLLVRRRLFESSSAVISVLGGAETERAELFAATGALIAGPAKADRNFFGLSVGAARASVTYDTLTWLLPNKAIVDVPLSFETEGVIGLGRDLALGAPMMHVDLWAGKAWLPWRSSLALADVWASGYLANNRWDAGTFRASLGFYQAAKRGFWTIRATGERLVNPDPDIRSFVTIDPTSRLVPDSRRLAEASVGVSVERDVRLRPLTRSWALDGALFVAGSSRLAAVDSVPEHTDVGMIGLGLRLSPTRLGRATARLDVCLPVVGSGVAKRGVYVGIGLSPWWGDDRHRASRQD
jgi:hypothetical protein